MRLFKLVIFSFFLLTACKNDPAKKKDSSAEGFPPAAPVVTEENSSSTEDNRRTTSDDGGVGSGRFSIEAPEGWTKSDTFLMGSNITFLRSQEEENDDFLENINVIKENVGDAGLEEFYEKSLSMLKRGLTGFEEGESDNKLINGIEFKNLKYRHSSSGMLLDVDLYLTIHRKIGFVITCTAKKGKLPQYQPAFDQVVTTFSFK